MQEIFKRVGRFHTHFLEELETVFNRCSSVSNVNIWYKKLDQLTRALEDEVGTYRQVEDHIFELKVINYLRNNFLRCKITYEPKGKKSQGKNCDVEVFYKDKRYLIEIKCFHPENKKQPIPQKYIAKNNVVIMDEGSYHSYQATRGHLMDVTYQAEEKIKNYDGEFISVLAVPDGFYLNIEELRNFVFIYRNGQPRPDDPLGDMTMHNIKRPFEQLINQFWAFPFPQEGFTLKSGKMATIVAPLRSQDTQLNL